MNDTATAHQAWDQRWRSPTERAAWLDPEADVIRCAKDAFASGGKRALDLGCGVGRHAQLLASLGFETHAIDGSEGGISYLESEAVKHGLRIATKVGPMTTLPYPDADFDYVLAFNVIYHGDSDIVRRTIAEIDRVLKPGGIYQGTMLSKLNVKYGVGREISPDVFVIDEDDEKDHPHFYCNEVELLTLFAGFDLQELVMREHEKPGSWHWHAIFRKPRT